jgi:phycocyanobilin:ferredoxin oxidoreductase
MALLYRCPSSLTGGSNGGGSTGSRSSSSSSSSSRGGRRAAAAAAAAAAAPLLHRRRPPFRPSAAAADQSDPSTDANAFFTPEQLVALSERREAEQQAALRDRLREYQEWERRGANGGAGAGARGAEREYWRAARAAARHLKFDQISATGEAGGAPLLHEATNKFPPAMAAEMVGLGTWRLRGSLDPAIEHAGARLEALLREGLDDELALYPPHKWKGRGWDYMDTEDPGNAKWGGWAHVDAPDPRRGEAGYPRLQVENRAYCSRAFRKLHLELARRQDGLGVLHAVFYPRLDFDLPIFALDLVAAGGQVTLAIVDVCPVRPGLALPPAYADAMARLQREHLPHLLEEQQAQRREERAREEAGAAAAAAAAPPSPSPAPSASSAGGSRVIPDWGRDIFSPFCVCLRPRSGAELAAFIEYASALCRAHLALANAANPLPRAFPSTARRLVDVATAHKRFCDRQLANAKTSRVLEVAFGAEATREYMRGLMFDFDPTDAPPWFDPSLVRLHTHLTETDPVPWSDLPKALALKQANMAGRSEATLRGVANFGALAAREAAGRGGPAGARLDEALQWLVDADPNFRAAAAQLGGVGLTTRGEDGAPRRMADGLAEMLLAEAGPEVAPVAGGGMTSSGDEEDARAPAPAALAPPPGAGNGKGA